MGANRFWVALALAALPAAAGGCYCLAIYGDPGSPCKAQGHRMSASEDAKLKKYWDQGTKEGQVRCAARLDLLLGKGIVFVAEGERAPRAKELLANECGPPGTGRYTVMSGATRLPLRDTNPALCDRLAKSSPPEAFALRREGAETYFYYFTYDVVPGGHVRMRDVYTKIAVDLGSLYFEPQHVLIAACQLNVRRDATDLGSAKMYDLREPPCWGTIFLESVAPDPKTREMLVDEARARLAFCYTHATFRQTTDVLEVDPDAG